MRADLVEEADDSDHLAAFVSSLDRIDDMIDDALVLARDTELTEPDSIDLEASVEAAWETVGTETATLRVGDLPVIEADDQLLLQLLENLFRNALEHVGDDVTISVEPLASNTADETTGFAVTDDGPGIDPDARDSIFDAGYTTDPSMGTGYGLAIVEKVASVHGWTVDVVESARGARFEVTGIASGTRSESSWV